MPPLPDPDAPINPATLMVAPELAALAILDEVIAIAAFALYAAHPRLGDPEPPDPDPPGAIAAGRLLDCLDRCRQQSARYRRRTLLELLEQARVDDDIPF
jgi:hypothetical protein